MTWDRAPRAGRPLRWSAELSFVADGAEGCQILRETSGQYVVLHDRWPELLTHAATLACAYTLCRTLELKARSDRQDG